MTRWKLIVVMLAVGESALAGCTSRRLDAPTIVHVQADRGWQRTGIQLDANQQFTIEYVSGEIRDRETAIPNAAGTGYICGSPDCCEPMPNERRSSLIARVGDHLFAVGNTAQLTTPDAGELLLRINDCNEGLRDNAGTLDVRIKP